MDPERPPPIATISAGLVVLVLCAASAWFYVQRAHRASVTPNSQTFQKAENTLKKQVKAGDAFAILPDWSAGQRWRFRKVWRHKGLRFDEAMIFADPLTSWDVDGFSRVWILATHDHDAQVAAAPVGRIKKRLELGQGTVLSLLELPRSRTVYDFKQRLRDATVTRLDAKGGEESCRWAGDEHRCSGAFWRNIKAGLHEVGGTRRRCIYAQPHPAKGQLRLHFGELPKATALHGRVGNQLWAVRYDEGSDVILRVLIDEKEAYRMALKRGDFSWHKFEVPLPPDAAGKPVTFVISADNPTWRQICLDARLLGPQATQK